MDVTYNDHVSGHNVHAVCSVSHLDSCGADV